MTLYTYRAAVERVVDGDTLDVVMDLGFKLAGRMRLRLAGLDTAELRDPDPVLRARGSAALSRVVGLLPVGTVCTITTDKPDPKDKYGRYLATVILPDGASLNALLVREGLARPYAGGKR